MKYFLISLNLLIFTNSAFANKICPQDWTYSLYFDGQNDIAIIETNSSNIRDLKGLKNEVEYGIKFNASDLSIVDYGEEVNLLVEFNIYRPNGRRAYISKMQELFPKVNLSIGNVLQSLQVLNPYSEESTICYNIEFNENVYLREVYEVIKEGGWIGSFMARPYRLANINIEIQKSSRSTFNLFSLYSK